MTDDTEPEADVDVRLPWHVDDDQLVTETPTDEPHPEEPQPPPAAIWGAL